MPICQGCQTERPIKNEAMQVCNACYVQFRRTGSFVRVREPRGKCTVEGCEKNAHGHGLCHMHRRRLKVSGNFDDPRADNYLLPTNKKLYSQWSSYQRRNAYPIVPEWRESFEAFMAGVGERPSMRHRLYRIDKSEPLGPGNFEWREGVVKREKEESEEAYNKRHRAHRRETTGTAAWDSDLKFKYGKDFSLRKLKEMAQAQNNLCAISGEPETTLRYGRPQHLAVDHIEGTEIIRQLLTGACNIGIGLFRHDISLMARAMLYLAKHDPDGDGQRKIDDAITYLQRHPVASLDKGGILPQE